MPEIARITLDNEMDLILAHRRSMKLAEMCGLSLSAQTTFATAVSEISRAAIGSGKNSYLVLSINALPQGRKEMDATLYDRVDLHKVKSEALAYAERLANLNLGTSDGFFTITLKHFIQFSGTITAARIESFKEYFAHEAPLSPYDEIRKKNMQLIDLSEKLRDRESQYRMLTDNLPLMMFIANPKGEITFANKWMKDFMDENQLGATGISWLALIHALDYNTIVADWETDRNLKTTFRAQAKLRSPNKDKTLWHMLSMVPIKNDKELVSSWIGFFVDINAQKTMQDTLKNNRDLREAQQSMIQVQRQLELKIEELNNSNHDLEQFAYIASHDLQEPLRKIQTFSNLVQRNPGEISEVEKYIKKIDSSAHRMGDLIKAVLDYSRLSTLDKRMAETDLTQVLDAVMADFELLINEKGAVIEKDTLPVIVGIPLQLSQLFANLLSNALKFSSDKPVIRIMHKMLSESEAGKYPRLKPSVPYIEIIFEDNGIGFDQQYSDKIFTIFQRLHEKDKYKGTGIGLALCKKIIQNHSGIINVYSQVGEGTRFNIFLPLQA